MSMLEPIHEILATKNAAREAALAISRRLVRVSANTIRSAHRGSRDEAVTGLAEGAVLVREIKAATANNPDVYHAGYTQDALKEFVEAQATVALLADEPLPRFEDLGVEAGAYLNGLGEAIGEARRAILDSIRVADIARAERLLVAAEDIHAELMTFDYPDALTNGLRRTTDAMRAILERTRGDVVMAARQARLEARLAAREGPA